jgi:hypothetical protein
MVLTVDGNATQHFFDTTGHTRPNMGWSTRTYFFTASSASTSLTFASATGDAFGPALDNVRLEAVPEPGTLLLGSGISALVLRRRRKS